MENKRVKTEIHFGRTGGFTNIPVEYLINAKGEVLRISAFEPDTVNRIPVKRLKSIIRELKDIDFKHIELNDPGNMSYFIKVRTREYENSVTWNDLTPNDTLKDFYKKLIRTIKPDP
ncbi:MAG TPA: hypothetical protein DDW27_14265 [Bacteroidales bacterium]|nr:hypothetical protein [Bacteroidales bacterium]